MDLSKVRAEQNAILEYLKTLNPSDPEYGKAVSNLVKLETVKVSDENAKYERELKTKQHDSKVAEEKRRYDLDKQIKVGQLELEKEEKKRRFELEKTEKNRRFESEKRLNDAEVSSKLAEIELNKNKFELSKEEFELSKQKFEHDRIVQLERLIMDGQMNQANIDAKLAEAGRYRSKASNVFVPIAQKGIAAICGLGACLFTVFGEETRVVTSKALSHFNSVNK